MTKRSMEQDREPRIYLYPINIFDWSSIKDQRKYKEQISINDIGTNGHPHAKKKKKIRHRPYRPPKNWLKIDHRLN